MLPSQHNSAQNFAIAAEAQLAVGEIEHAEELFERAAALEEEALNKIPADKHRTIGIIGISAASLWYRAARYADAERVAQSLLDNPNLLPSAREQLEDIIIAIPQSVSIASGGAMLSLFAPPARPTKESLRIVRQLRQIRTNAKQEQALEDAYLRHRTLLLHIALRKFRIPDADAETLVQEVFAAFSQRSETVVDPKSWLIGAICSASRHYWRFQGKIESLPSDIAEHADPKTLNADDDMITQLTVRQALDYLQPRYRNALLLHYFEGRSAADIAHVMNTTPRYAEKLIYQGLKRFREIYATIIKIRAT